MARVGFVGTGEIASAMVHGLAGEGHQILVSDRNVDRARHLAATVEGVRIVPNADVVSGSDIVFLCLLAKVAGEVLAELPFRPGQSVISAMVDVPMKQLRAFCAPATDIAITIPLPPIAKGGCPLPVFPDSAALHSLFGARNPVFAVKDEAALNAHFGATALCSPLLAQMIATANWLATHTGDPVKAEAYVSNVIRAYLPETPSAGHLAADLFSLSTEGGLNATLRAAMSPALPMLEQGLTGFHSRLGLLKTP